MIAGFQFDVVLFISLRQELPLIAWLYRHSDREPEAS
jgi:hypothetical protein